jgi:hypothetical protein
MYVHASYRAPTKPVLDEARRKSIAQELAANFEAEIRNPLKDIPRAELLKDVEAFRRDYNLPEDSLVYLRKGAIVAQNPAGFEDEPEIDEADKLALREEVTRRWHHPKPLYFTIILNSIAAAVQGWDQVSEIVVSNSRYPEIETDTYSFFP